MCDERERLIGYLYGESDVDERRAVDRHLEQCETCRDEMGALRAVREDLLAWDVPEHGSVWRPFAPARLRPWYREVPAWAMAAAAAVMFLCGATGSVVAQRVFAPAAPSQTARRTPGPAPELTTIATGVTPADLEALERRVVDRMHLDLARLDQRVQLASAHGTGPALVRVSSGDQDLAERITQLNAEYIAISQDLANRLANLNQRVNTMDTRTRDINNALQFIAANSNPTGGSGGER
jgi:hypothetical protein